MTRKPEHIEHLVIGAGITGLAYANFIRIEASARGAQKPQACVLEADMEPGGYCKTISQDGFVWDYSGHFFHFRHPEIEHYLKDRMDPGEDIRTVVKKATIRFKGGDVDFPFQKNIHQLPREDFIACLHDLFFREVPREVAEPNVKKPQAGSFAAMLYAKLGRGISDRFLIPYNEKLYACDLNDLDAEAMGRFFPHVNLEEIMRHMASATDGVPDASAYNATFTYPRGGAMQYVHALLKDLEPDDVVLNEKVEAIDIKAKIVTTDQRQLTFDRLVSSVPLPQLLQMCALDHDENAFTWNKVLVFNLGFDKKGPAGVHWMYFPDRALRFYRVGFYDNIMESDRMSLYVEIGARTDETFDVEAEKARVLADLEKEGIIAGHQLLSSHSVVLDPAYVHITKASLAETARTRSVLEGAGIYSAGRYGAWTYCSIEDNILEARDLAARLGPLL